MPRVDSVTTSGAPASTGAPHPHIISQNSDDLMDEAYGASWIGGRDDYNQRYSDPDVEAHRKAVSIAMLATLALICTKAATELASS